MLFPIGFTALLPRIALLEEDRQGLRRIELRGGLSPFQALQAGTLESGTQRKTFERRLTA